MRTFTLVFAVALLIAQSLKVEAQPRRYGPPIVERRIGLDALAFEGTASDSDRVDVYLAIPYSALTFLYAGDRYVADFAAILQVSDRRADQMILDKYQTYTVLEPVGEHEKRMERGLERADAEQFSVTLPAGREFEVRLNIRDLSSHHEFDTVVRLETPSFSPTATSLSDIMIYRSRRGQRVMPLIGGDVGTVPPKEAGVFAEAYHLPADTSLFFITEVFATKDDLQPSDEDPVQRVITRVTVRDTSGALAPWTAARTSLFQSVPFEDIWMGQYVLQSFLVRSASDTAYRTSSDLRKHAIAFSSRGIWVSTQRGIPVAEGDLDEAIEQLHLIATGSERDSLDMARGPVEKREAVLDFWRKRDPDRYGSRAGSYQNRPMQIFYLRVQYANAHFRSGLNPGWRSDRGRVYIELGPPDYVDAHPFEAMQKPYEVWEYSMLHTKYTFVDEYMLGDYRLVGAPPPSGMFLWDR